MRNATLVQFTVGVDVIIFWAAFVVVSALLIFIPYFVHTRERYWSLGMNGMFKYRDNRTKLADVTANTALRSNRFRKFFGWLSVAIFLLTVLSALMYMLLGQTGALEVDKMMLAKVGLPAWAISMLTFSMYLSNRRLARILHGTATGVLDEGLHDEPEWGSRASVFEEASPPEH